MFSSSDYSFIINKPIDYSCLDSTNQHISNSNYILNIISPTCEDCYVNLNKWELIASQNKKLQKKIIFLVIGDEFERVIFSLSVQSEYDRIVYDSRFIGELPHS